MHMVRARHFFMASYAFQNVIKKHIQSCFSGRGHADRCTVSDCGCRTCEMHSIDHNRIKRLKLFARRFGPCTWCVLDIFFRVICFQNIIEKHIQSCYIGRRHAGRCAESNCGWGTCEMHSIDHNGVKRLKLSARRFGPCTWCVPDIFFGPHMLFNVIRKAYSILVQRPETC